MNINRHPLLVVPCGSYSDLADRVSRRLKLPQLGKTNKKAFMNGEVLTHQLQTIRDHDVFVIFQPRMGEERLLYDMGICELLVHALKQGSPYRITVVCPYWPFGRQDRKTNHREPIFASTFGVKLKSLGADAVITLQLHNPSSQSVFPLIPMENVQTTKFIYDHIKSYFNKLDKLMVVSPDFGGVEMARYLASKLDIPGNLAIVYKFRDKKTANDAKVITIIGDVDGFDCLIIDDIGDTMGTMVKNFKALKENGAKNIYAVITHSLFSGNAVENLNSVDFTKIWVTDTSPLSQEQINSIKNLEVIPSDKWLAQVIDNTHNGKSVTELWEEVEQKQSL